MPRWSDTPPTGTDQPSYRIIRTPADKSITLCVTSEGITGCVTHFVQNRTVPCEGEPVCQHCQEGHSWRWHGYLSGIMAGTHEHVLFEFTAPPSDTFRNYLQIAGTLRGCIFTANRPSGRPNGRVVVACKSPTLSHLQIPDPPNIRNILCRVWNIQNNAATPVPSPRPPIKNTAVAPSKRDGRYRSNPPHEPE